VTGGWGELHNEELHNLYSMPSIIRMIKSRRMSWSGYVSRMREKRNPYRILVGKRPVERSRCRWVDNMGLREVGFGRLDRIDLVQDRDQWRALVNMVMNLQVS
jgi:hypothetical protein